jgi:peptide deformylase
MFTKSAALAKLAALGHAALHCLGQLSSCQVPTTSAAAAAAAAAAAVDKLEWSTPLCIIKYPDPRLRAVNAKIGVFDDSLKQLANQMFDVMYQ